LVDGGGQASFAPAFGILVWSDVRFQAGADLSIPPVLPQGRFDGASCRSLALDDMLSLTISRRLGTITA
jgi:hypothetical protein